MNTIISSILSSKSRYEDRGAGNATGIRPLSARGRQKAARANGLPLAMLVICLLWVGPILACGSFQPRPAPTRQPPPIAPAEATSPPLQPSPTSTPTQPQPTATITPSPTPTAVTNRLNVGDQARVIADGGVNLRREPGTGAPIVALLAKNKRLVVQAGPTQSDGYIWWKVDDNQGNIGWVAEGDGDVEWISLEVGEPRPVNRPPEVEDQVVVTVEELNVRVAPRARSTLVTRVRRNEEFSVVAGPRAADGLTWYQIRSDDGEVEGWAADGRGDERWLTPLE